MNPAKLYTETECFIAYRLFATKENRKNYKCLSL